jgi:hypothetical protein
MDPALAVALLRPLAEAEDALSRLDALAAAAAPAVRDGLVARLALAEASGWLAVSEIWIDPRDLALREARMTGSATAALMLERLGSALPATVQAAAVPHLEAPADAAIEQALALAAALRQGADPLQSPDAFLATLAPLGPAAWPARSAVEGVPPPDFEPWRDALLAPLDTLPALPAAALAAAAWARQAGEAEPARPTEAQALLLAAALLRRRARAPAVPLPFWAAFAHGPRRRPRLQDPQWPAAFLAEVAEAARRGLAELAWLNAAAARAASLAARERSHGQAGKAAEIALRQPVVTAAGLATALGATPQGALLIIKRLMAAGILREATGRTSFRAFMV